MSTWKKVALDGNILAAVGGGDQTNKLGGGSGTTNEIITSAASGGAGRVTLAQHELVIGDAGNTSVNAQITGGDVNGTLSGSNINLAIQNNKITNGMLKDDIIRLAEIGHGSGSESFGGTNVDIRGGILYWKDGATDGAQEPAPLADDGHPAIAVPGSAGQVLTVVDDGNGNLNPGWAAAATSPTVTINNGSGSTTAQNILFGRGDGSGNLDANKVYEDTGLQWFADDAFAHADGANTAGLVSDTGFKGNLAGTATTATKTTTALAADNTLHYLLMTTANTGQTSTELKTQEVISVKPQSTLANSVTTISGNVSIGGDLTVSGSTTTLNTTELNVEDTEIQVASMAFADNGVYSEDVQTATGDFGVGLVIFNGQGDGLAAAEGQDAVAASDFQASSHTRKARFLYHGHKGSTTYTASNSVLGWTIAQEGKNGTPETNVVDALPVVDSFGVGVMHVTSTALTAQGGDDNLDIGIGAMAYDGTDLWIQTAITS